MKLAARISMLFALAAFAAPTLACDGMKQTSTDKKATVAKAEKKAAKAESAKVKN